MVQAIHAKTGGDDLDDGLELDPTMLASDGEVDEDLAERDDDDDSDDDSASLGEGSAAGFLSAEEDVVPVTAAARKRKAGDEDDENESGAAGAAGTSKEDKKRRRKEKDRARKAKRLQAELQELESPASMSPEALAAVMLRSIREAFPAATPMEIEDTLLPIDRLLSPVADVQTDAGEFAPLLARLASIFTSAPKPKKLVLATPRVVILSLSGMRCADVVRAVRDVDTGGEVGKLFAKHFKLADQVKYLARTKVGIAVGTPARVGALLAQGALKVSPETIVLLDIGHRDSKNRGLLNLPEVRDELWKTVFRGPARNVLIGGGARFATF